MVRLDISVACLLEDLDFLNAVGNLDYRSHSSVDTYVATASTCRGEVGRGTDIPGSFLGLMQSVPCFILCSLQGSRWSWVLHSQLLMHSPSSGFRCLS